MVRLLLPLVLVLITLGVIVGIDDQGDEAEFTFVNRGDVFTLDPQRMSFLQDFRMAYLLYDRLVKWDNTTFEITGGVASLPEIDETRTQYTFTIRDDARWSNGAPVTAADFLWSWQRLLTPDTAADYSNLFFGIKGAKEYWAFRNAQLAAFSRDDRSGGERGEAAVAMWEEAQEHFLRHVGIEAVDGRTLQVSLTRPIPYFLDLLAFGVCSPVYRPCVEGWEVDDQQWKTILSKGWHEATVPSFEDRRWVDIDEDSGMLRQLHQWARPGRLVGNGPYTLDQWRYKRDMRLSRSPTFHSPNPRGCESILALSIEDPSTAVLAFESGALDWLSDVNVDYQADMIAQQQQYESRYAQEMQRSMATGLSREEALSMLPAPGVGERRNIHVYPTFGTDYYSFNCRPTLHDGRLNPFHDSGVRRAFVKAVDKQAIVDRATRLREPVATTFIPRGSIPGYDSPDGLAYDPDGARRALREAGWIDRDDDGMLEDEAGTPFPVIDLLYTTNTPRYKWISLMLKDQWERELGVQVELRGGDTKFYKEDLRQGKFMIGRSRWYGDYGDPTTFLDLNRSTDGNNDRGFNSPRYDAMLDAASAERDPEKRMAMLSACEAVLVEEELPLLPICQLVQVYMFEPGTVRGLTTHPRLVQFLDQVEMGK